MIRHRNTLWALTQDCSGKQNKVETVYSGFRQNPGPRHLPLDSGCGEVEFAGVFASVASLAPSVVPESIFRNLAQKNF